MLVFIKKYFPIIFFIIFIVFFSIFNREEFIKNYEKNILDINQNINIEKNVSDFKLEDIKYINKTEFYYTPYKKLLDKIVDKINNSKKRVYVEVYMLTETRIQNALIKSKNRGIDVRVILEKNPYKANSINNKAFSYLDNSGVDVVWSNPDLYSLNHSKFIIIDDGVIISTGNFTYSTFVFNRDLFLFSYDKNILAKFLEIFKGDFGQKKIMVYDDNLVLSPSYSRYKFRKMFLKSKKSLDMYFQYLEDKNLEDILINKAESGVKIRIIVSDDFYKNNSQKIEKLKELGLNIKSLKIAKMHSKAILVDGKYLFIGSVNFSSYSLDKNREIGLIFTNKEIILKFNKLFEKDFALK